MTLEQAQKLNPGDKLIFMPKLYRNAPWYHPFTLNGIYTFQEIIVKEQIESSYILVKERETFGYGMRIEYFEPLTIISEVLYT